MYKHITNAARTIIKTLPIKAKRLCGASICEVSPVLERSPKADGLIHYCCSKKSVDTGIRCWSDSVPDYYTKYIETIHHEAVQENFSDFLGRLRKVSARPAFDETVRDYLPHYYIDKIVGNGKGSGTRDVQSVVLKSLKDPDTNGRVMLEACCIDEKTHPAGFYYKLGFRHSIEEYNAVLENWLKEGGKRENAPFAQGIMYLPKENILQCLNYGNPKYNLKSRLLIQRCLIKNKILSVMNRCKKYLCVKNN